MIEWGVDAGRRIVDLAGPAQTIAVIGTAKNVGKTTALREICSALAAPFGALSVGRDGEARDILDAQEKPLLVFDPGTLVATARSLVARSPACEIVRVTTERGALGSIVIVRTRRRGAYEIAGPATARALRRIVDEMFALGAQRIVIDGALDRMSALRSGDAVVVATGAAAGSSLRRTVELTLQTVRRLQTAAYDPALPFFRVEGALTGELASRFARDGERRQIVVADATRIVARGPVVESLNVRCEAPVRPIACTVSSRSTQRTFDLRGLLVAVAAATKLPVFDVYAGAAA